MMKAVIFDIDGTLADNSHRQLWVQQRPKDWDKYNDTMNMDLPVHRVISLLKMFVYGGHKALLCTGRNEQYRQRTVLWLRNNNVPFDYLYMRRDNDRRPDYIVKEEMLGRILESGFVPEYVVDDRKSVVDMWRKNGLLCLQCADGDF